LTHFDWSEIIHFGHDFHHGFLNQFLVLRTRVYCIFGYCGDRRR
jgi:hypothetical protein